LNERDSLVHTWMSSSCGKDLSLVCSDLRENVHRGILAAFSPLIRDILESEQDKEVVLLFPGLESVHLQQFVELLYCGEVVGFGVSEVEELTKLLLSIGVPGDRVAVERLKQEKLEDDVFDAESDVAMDLSPVNRHPPVSADQFMLATSRRMSALSKISQAIHKPSFPIKPPNSSGSSIESRTFSSTSSEEQLHNIYKRSNSTILNRIKKPKPLPLPPLEHSSNYLLKPKTPRTPLIASPDCRVLEEKFKHLIEDANPSDTEKLRNLSVSSADFNFDPSSTSQPGTPFRAKAFNFPPTPAADSHDQGSSLDLSVKKITESPPLPIPIIRVIKPEPADHLDERTLSPVNLISPSKLANFPTVPLSPNDMTLNTSSSIVSISNRHQFSFPFREHSSSPVRTTSAILSGNTGRPMITQPFSPGTESEGTGSALDSNPPYFSPKKINRKAENPNNKQSFKCQKCGKCYNWNYNLNRHMRFECGIENRFECSLCQKRFPYKQNAAIHLKRKHKVTLETADDMLLQGQITILPSLKNRDHEFVNDNNNWEPG